MRQVTFRPDNSARVKIYRISTDTRPRVRARLPRKLSLNEVRSRLLAREASHV